MSKWFVHFDEAPKSETIDAVRGIPIRGRVIYISAPRRTLANYDFTEAEIKELLDPSKETQDA